MYIKSTDSTYLLLVGVGICVFLMLIKWHNLISHNKQLQEGLLLVNQNELDFLNHGTLPYDAGKDFINHGHPYSSDLDITGTKSLFHYLNRTGLYQGKEYLAQYLLHKKEPSQILENQSAIKELAQKLRWRQHFLALAQIDSDTKPQYKRLLEWTKQEVHQVPSLLFFASYLVPFIVISSGLLYCFIDEPLYWETFKYGFLLNLLLTASLSKLLKKEVAQTTDIKKILSTYSRLIAHIEDEQYETTKNQALQGLLSSEKNKASVLIKKLSNHFGQLDNIQNPIGAIFINGLTMFHVHSFKRLQQWKQLHAHKVSSWINTLGELEALSSLANFSYNNPGYVFPAINDTYQLEFKNLGHPLIAADQRVNNDLDFNAQNFIILTGSNMSGKSTFLRSLGVNMALANAGAPVCANAANIHPLPILVSMRVSDSLEDNESYFFAEVKRLKYLLEEAGKNRSLLLLDEILRGTNSDDKRAGTVAVINKILEYQAIGAIATHDLKVCDISALHPDYLVNQCFEVDIENNELVFDYKLRKGVCQNQSATFLMKKMKVI